MAVSQRGAHQGQHEGLFRTWRVRHARLLCQWQRTLWRADHAHFLHLGVSRQCLPSQHLLWRWPRRRWCTHGCRARHRRYAAARLDSSARSHPAARLGPAARSHPATRLGSRRRRHAAARSDSLTRSDPTARHGRAARSRAAARSDSDGRRHAGWVDAGAPSADGPADTIATGSPVDLGHGCSYSTNTFEGGLPAWVLLLLLLLLLLLAVRLLTRFGKPTSPR